MKRTSMQPMVQNQQWVLIADGAKVFSASSDFLACAHDVHIPFRPN
jgi:hypothetical protein